MNPQEVSYNVPTNLNNNTFVRTGYTFTGWNTKRNGSGNAYTNLQSVTLTNNLTLYAQWEINNYTITFNSNGGEGTMSSEEAPYNSTINLNVNTFTKIGHITILESSQSLKENLSFSGSSLPILLLEQI